MRTCPLCGAHHAAATLAEAGWVDAATAARLAGRHAGWRRADGACPACVQDALLSLLVERGESTLGRVVQALWPLDAAAAFGALPTPLRLRADPRFTGRGVTIALVDAGFHPHADLVQPTNRIRAWADAGGETVVVRHYAEDERPTWPGAACGEALQWHGLMTSACAAGNGWMSHGLYRGMAPDAELVLVQARGADGRIGSARIARALRWIAEHRARLGIRLVSISLGGEPAEPPGGNAVDDAVAALVDDGVVVVAASGNDGVRHLVPPATAPRAITVGGIDDHNVFDAEARTLWHASYGNAADGRRKPELVAPSVWVAAPLLPETEVAREATTLFARRAACDDAC
ncbi:MAG: S8 family serine peptidase, partial [Gemmatirosa sp.]|nr:S8 family serine peptidase [Gemmatirosa sp.]